MAIKNPPPNLQAFADTPAKQQAAQDLYQFLYLIWESLGGGVDLVEQTIVQSASETTTEAAHVKDQRIDELFALLQTQSRETREFEQKLEQALALLSTQQTQTRMLEQSIKQLTAMVQTNA
jgi:hypothetical protein